MRRILILLVFASCSPRPLPPRDAGIDPGCIRVGDPCCASGIGAFCGGRDDAGRALVCSDGGTCTTAPIEGVDSGA